MSAFWSFFQAPRPAEVYNIGGSRHSNISILEAIDFIGRNDGGELEYSLSDETRVGDHIWYVSDVGKFQRHYPDWQYDYTIEEILLEMIAAAKR